jgi:uridine kinase
VAGVSARAAVIAALAHDWLARPRTDPLLIGVDGRTAAGKTTFADDLANALQSSGTDVIRATIDDFHLPAVIRHRQGRFSPDGYYDDARDLPAFRRLLLQPCAPGGDRLVVTRAFDLNSDHASLAEPRRIPEDALLIVDGTFLQRPELAGMWDVIVYLKVSAKEARRRGIARDQATLGGKALATRLYDERYEPAFLRYERECRPELKADLLIDHEDPASPMRIAAALA